MVDPTTAALAVAVMTGPGGDGGRKPMLVAWASPDGADTARRQGRQHGCGIVESII
jgi:hypothetical protein